MAGDVGPGTIVRVALRGRRVRGWIVEDHVDPEAQESELLPLAKVSSAGPPADLVALTEWAAWRWVGPRSTFLRAASPPNAVTPEARGRRRPWGADARTAASDPEVETLASRVAGEAWAVLRWPPVARMAELLRRLVSPEGSTLVVLPDAERVEALAAHLRRAGIPAVVFRGESSAAVRTRAWVDAREGGCVVVGGRVAVWAPVPDLSAVVVVDEVDEAMKEERAPAWHARDVAVERARRAGARVTVVSPAPTLEARALVPEVVAPSRRGERAGWGRVVAVDRRDDPPGTGMFSPVAVEAMRQGAGAGRVVCVLNRKGRARLLACDACRRVIRCETCGGAAAEDDAGLACRVCGTTRPRVCAECGSTVLRALQVGIRRLREELTALLPRAEVAEVDAGAVHVPGASVLVGTEAVLHRVSDASLVAFLDFDQELLAPRFRACEQALWLLVRAVRLTGARDSGRVVVQTRMPDHEVIRAAVSADPDLVGAAERARRRALRLPPFGGLAEVVGDPDALRLLAHGLVATEGVELHGPVAGQGGKERALVRAPDTSILCDALVLAAPKARARGRLRIDVDPLRV